MRARSLVQSGPAAAAGLGMALFLLACGAALLSFAGSLSGPAVRAGLPAALGSPGFITAVALYMVSHLLRSLRLLLLLLETEHSFAKVLRLHAGLAWVALLLPFKPLGDAYRMMEISHDQGGAAVGPFVVMVERFLDALVILCLAATAALLSPGALRGLTPLIAVLLLVAAVSAALYRGLPGFFAYLRSQLVRRSRSQWKTLLPRLHQFDGLLKLGHDLIHDRISVLLALSAGIWGAEWACVSVLYRNSADAAGGTWLPALLKAFSALLTAKGDLMSGFPLYGLVTFAGLAIAGFPLWLAYCRLRAASGAARIRSCAAAAGRYELAEYRYETRRERYGR